MFLRKSRKIYSKLIEENKKILEYIKKNILKIDDSVSISSLKDISDFFEMNSLVKSNDNLLQTFPGISLSSNAVFLFDRNEKGEIFFSVNSKLFKYAKEKTALLYNFSNITVNSSSIMKCDNEKIYLLSGNKLAIYDLATNTSNLIDTYSISSLSAYRSDFNFLNFNAKNKKALFRYNYYNSRHYLGIYDLNTDTVVTLSESKSSSSKIVMLDDGVVISDTTTSGGVYSLERYNYSFNKIFSHKDNLGFDSSSLKKNAELLLYNNRIYTAFTSVYNGWYLNDNFKVFEFNLLTNTLKEIIKGTEDWIFLERVLRYIKPKTSDNQTLYESDGNFDEKRIYIGDKLIKVLSALVNLETKEIKLDYFKKNSIFSFSFNDELYEILPSNGVLSTINRGKDVLKNA